MHWCTQLMGSIKKWHLSESEPCCILALQGSSQTGMWSSKCCTNCRPGPSTPWAAPGVPRQVAWGGEKSAGMRVKTQASGSVLP